MVLSHFCMKEQDTRHNTEIKCNLFFIFLLMEYYTSNFRSLLNLRMFEYTQIIAEFLLIDEP